MSTDNTSIVVKNNEDEQRYEVKMDGHLAELVYERNGDKIIYLHTGVPPALENRGIASTMAHYALEEARAAGLSVVPLCPYVASYIRRHQEYLPLVLESERERLLRG